MNDLESRLANWGACLRWYRGRQVSLLRVQVDRRSPVYRRYFARPGSMESNFRPKKQGEQWGWAPTKAAACDQIDAAIVETAVCLSLRNALWRHQLLRLHYIILADPRHICRELSRIAPWPLKVKDFDMALSDTRNMVAAALQIPIADQGNVCKTAAHNSTTADCRARARSVA